MERRESACSSPARAAATVASRAMTSARFSRVTKVSAFSKLGNSQRAPCNQNERSPATGRLTSLPSISRRAGSDRKNVPGLKRIANHSPFAGQCTGRALVSGPRSVTLTAPFKRVKTSSQCGEATDENVPLPSLWQLHTRSMSGESEGRSRSKTMNMVVAKVAPAAFAGATLGLPLRFPQLKVRASRSAPHRPE